MKLSEADISRIIEMAWEDRTPFDAIESQFNLSHDQVVKIMRDNLNRNSGLRKTRLAWYIATDLFKDGQMDLVLEEMSSVIDGLDQSYREIGRDNHTQYFLKVHSEKIAKILSMLGQKELLKDMKELDPDRREIYQSALETISK